jgi:serine/threonine-protein kinase RsbW
VAPSTPSTPASPAPPVTRVALRLPALIRYRPIAIELIGALLRHVDDADQDFRNEMVTAFGEAFNNIVLHGYRGRLDGILEIEAEMTPDQIRLCLLDQGHEVDFGSVQVPDLASMPESGMGVFMMHALVDEVDYRGGSPNMLSLIKRTAGAGEKR